MLTFSMISVALANTTGDPTTTYVIIGVIIFFLIVAASSGTSRKFAGVECEELIARDGRYDQLFNLQGRRISLTTSKCNLLRISTWGVRENFAGCS